MTMDTTEYLQLADRGPVTATPTREILETAPTSWSTPYAVEIEVEAAGDRTRVRIEGQELPGTKAAAAEIVDRALAGEMLSDNPEDLRERAAELLALANTLEGHGEEPRDPT